LPCSTSGCSRLGGEAIAFSEVHFSDLELQNPTKYRIPTSPEAFR